MVPLIFAGGGTGLEGRGDRGGEMLYCFLMTTLVLRKTGGEGKHRGTCLFPERFFLHVQLDTKDP